MAGTFSPDEVRLDGNTSNQGQDDQRTGYAFALVSLTSLFFIWGFLTSLNDILIPHLKNVFSLNYTQAMLIQFCFFGAYFIVSLPAGRLVRKIGYQKGIVFGLIIAGIGCLAFYPAAALQAYPVFLGALFIMASGITLLQVSANPYVTALGSSKTASGRLTMTQAFNSLGTTVAPLFGAVLILTAATTGLEQLSEAQFKAQEAQAVQGPYLMLAFSLMLLAFIFSRLNLPVIASHQQQSAQEKNLPGIWSHRHLMLGAIAIFVYVGAEVSIGSFLINFLGEENIAGMAEAEAAALIAYYWGGAMVGRFIGAIIMQKVAAGKLLALNALLATAMVVIAMSLSGNIAMYAILLVGLFNSIMFPTIFSLALRGLKHHTSQGSGILCLAIVGGAIVPLLQGILADNIGIQLSFILPLLCYLYIGYYGLFGSKSKSS
ncbi:sugar MFS transporter [Thalassomonas actiniarum]|uniref:Sugar MFS transporter n=1 Tax=Thalassomonas actiniarum TaxID=485447 RepID=A0AAE9YSA8_9GAMM|nr:sugar MFS transporter [Thalassomonas actiniarum]WDD99931.1 sugar MFS transporter [Thalassomonas actiniarum]